MNSVKRDQKVVSIAGQETSKPMYVATYLVKTTRAGPLWPKMCYEFFVVDNPDALQSKNIAGLDLVSVIEADQIWSRDLEDYSKKPLLRVGGLANLGNITYDLTKPPYTIQLAVTNHYNPRGFLEKGKAPRIAYFIEETATRDLMARGVTHISTSSHANRNRRKQLRKPSVALPLGEPVPIQDWLAALARGKELARVKREETGAFWRFFRRA